MCSCPLYHCHLFTPHLYAHHLYTCHLYTRHLYTRHLYTCHLYTRHLYTCHLYAPHLYAPHLYTCHLYGPHLYTCHLHTCNCTPVICTTIICDICSCPLRVRRCWPSMWQCMPPTSSRLEGLCQLFNSLPNLGLLLILRYDLPVKTTHGSHVCGLCRQVTIIQRCVNIIEKVYGPVYSGLYRQVVLRTSFVEHISHCLGVRTQQLTTHLQYVLPTSVFYMFRTSIFTKSFVRTSSRQVQRAKLCTRHLQT